MAATYSDGSLAGFRNRGYGGWLRNMAFFVSKRPDLIASRSFSLQGPERTQRFRLSKSQMIKIASGVYGYPGEHDGSAECVDLTLKATRRRSADASGSFIDFVAERLLECAPN